MTPTSYPPLPGDDARTVERLLGLISESLYAVEIRGNDIALRFTYQQVGHHYRRVLRIPLRLVYRDGNRACRRFAVWLMGRVGYSTAPGLDGIAELRDALQRLLVDVRRHELAADTDRGPRWPRRGQRGAGRMTDHPSAPALARGIEYLDQIPAPDAIPPGRVVVHNSVRPRRRLGASGFRAWLAPPGDRLARCECGWAPELGEHYRVVREARS